MLRVTVSGSFHRHMGAIHAAVQELLDLGVKVLSPADPRIVDARGEFLFVASDRVRSIRMVQDRHLESVRSSDFLWLVTPDGYVGQSASMEVGFAVASNVPVFSLSKPYDMTLRQYVRQVGSVKDALRSVASQPRPTCNRPRFLIDPHASLGEAHETLERIAIALRGPAGTVDDEAAENIYSERDSLLSIFGRNKD